MRFISCCFSSASAECLSLPAAGSPTQSRWLSSNPKSADRNEQPGNAATHRIASRQEALANARIRRACRRERPLDQERTAALPPTLNDPAGPMAEWLERIASAALVVAIGLTAGWAIQKSAGPRWRNSIRGLLVATALIAWA